jgi:hypothetical protein
VKLKDLPKKLVNFLTFLAFLAFLALIATGPLLLSSCENTFKDTKGEKREIAPLEVVERNGYSVSKDHYNREFAMVPKGSPIPDEVLKKYGPESIVRTPPEKIIVASGTYDPGVIFALGKGDTIIGTTEPYETWALRK